MRFFALITAVLLTAVSAARAFQGYENLSCQGEPTGLSACDGGCHSFKGFSSFRADVGIRPTRHCVEMWTGPDCTGTPFVYPDQVFQCTFFVADESKELPRSGLELHNSPPRRREDALSDP
ncbi:hypothetical protein AURDEDRAFT_153824 [Auricularia subglabra TFB-10046 SS5]|nr:hypothetical protein AURDEDRAFT_153824 [Auricularia subglabra TFB-10046 SS5]